MLRRDVKNLLEKAKAKKEWGEFILDLYNEAQNLKSKKAFNELTKLLNDDDLNAISKSSKEFRENFKFR